MLNVLGKLVAANTDEAETLDELFASVFSDRVCKTHVLRDSVQGE